MEAYTREQLIEAFQKWNKEALKEPYNFEEDLEPTKQFATKQVDHLISLIE